MNRDPEATWWWKAAWVAITITAIYVVFVTPSPATQEVICAR